MKRLVIVAALVLAPAAAHAQNIGTQMPDGYSKCSDSPDSSCYDGPGESNPASYESGKYPAAQHADNNQNSYYRPVTAPAPAQSVEPQSAAVPEASAAAVVVTTDVPAPQATPQVEVASIQADKLPVWHRMAALGLMLLLLGLYGLRTYRRNG